MVYLSRRPGGEEVNALVCKTDMRGCESPPGLKSYIVVKLPSVAKAMEDDAGVAEWFTQKT